MGCGYDWKWLWIETKRNAALSFLKSFYHENVLVWLHVIQIFLSYASFCPFPPISVSILSNTENPYESKFCLLFRHYSIMIVFVLVFEIILFLYLRILLLGTILYELIGA